MNNEASEVSNRIYDKIFGGLTLFLVSAHLGVFLQDVKFMQSSDELSEKALEMASQAYSLLGYGVAISGAVIILGIFLGNKSGWWMSCLASFFNLCAFFGLFSISEIYLFREAKTDPVIEVYVFSFLFTVTIFIFGYIASPKTQASYGLTVDFATDPMNSDNSSS